MVLDKMKASVWKVFVFLDSWLKFPALKPGEIGIQIGFDMIAPITCDVFSMFRRVKPNGQVIAIDPDPFNIEEAKKVVTSQKRHFQFVQCVVFSQPGTTKLLLGQKPSWNRVNNIPVADVPLSGRTLEVPMDTLDNIVNKRSVDINKIGHISLTINGSEYYALLGMKKILTQCKDLALTVVTGRQSITSDINGRKDVDVIRELLIEYGFRVKFRRIHQLFWWGFMVKTLLNRKWIYGKKNYGILMAAKGSKKIPWYQSFS